MIECRVKMIKLVNVLSPRKDIKIRHIYWKIWNETWFKLWNGINEEWIVRINITIVAQISLHSNPDDTQP